MKKTKRKKGTITLYIWLLLLLTALVVFVAILSVQSQNASVSYPLLPSPSSTAPTTPSVIPLTPTIYPSKDKPGWHTFVYPDPKRKYTFEYPGGWTLEETDSETGSRVTLIGFKSNTEYVGIQFLITGRGLPPTDYEETLITKYGGREATQKNFYVGGRLTDTVISFNDQKQDPFATIYIYYKIVDKKDAISFQQTVNQILSTLTFYY